LPQIPEIWQGKDLLSQDGILPQTGLEPFMRLDLAHSSLMRIQLFMQSGKFLRQLDYWQTSMKLVLLLISLIPIMYSMALFARRADYAE
jgi:hypothetical protein